MEIGKVPLEEIGKVVTKVIDERTFFNVKYHTKYWIRVGNAFIARNVAHDSALSKPDTF